MALTARHHKVSTWPASTNTARVRAALDWNEDHEFGGGTAGQVMVCDPTHTVQGLDGTTVAVGAIWQSKKEFDVRDYGARLDGVANDTAAVQAAATAAGAAGGGLVCIPPGTCLCETYTSIGGTPIGLYLPDNVDLCGTGIASVLVGGGSPTSSGGFIGFGTIAPMSYESSAVPYPIDAATLGAFAVTTATHGHAANFAAGDDVLLVGGAGLDTREMNVVDSANSVSGVVLLRYALAKDFTGGTRTIANVTALTARRREIRDLRILTSRQAFIGAQAGGVTFRNLTVGVVSGFTTNLFQLNYIRGLTIADCDLAWTSTGTTNGIDPGRSCSDIRIHNNRIATNANAIGLGEGAAHCSITSNQIYCRDAFGVPAIAAGTASDVRITDNDIYFSTATGSVPAIYDAHGGLSRRVKIANNTLSVVGAGNYAIQAESVGTIVEHNQIRSAVGGIWLTGADQAALGNQIELTVGGPFGILVEAVLHSQRIIGNGIRNSGTVGGTGIRVLDAGMQVESPIITENAISNFTAGITIDNAGNEPTLVNDLNRVV